MVIPKTVVALVFAYLIANVPCLAGEKEATPMSFREQCSGFEVGHKQARWHCTNRPYGSPEALRQDLKSRFPRGVWRVAGRDPALRNVQGRMTWWDCNPGKSPCGYWIQFGEEQFIFLQQLLDADADNGWLGIGVTTFCGGTQAECDALVRAAAGILDESEDFGRVLGTSMIGVPPFAPPPRRKAL